MLWLEIRFRNTAEHFTGNFPDVAQKGQFSSHVGDNSD